MNVETDERQAHQDRARPRKRQNGHVKSEQAEVDRKNETCIDKRQQERLS
jgi:hypothetical protein